MGGGNIVYGYKVMDVSTNMLAEVKHVRLNGIICMICMLQLVVKDALGL